MSSRSASDISDVKKSWLVSGADALSMVGLGVFLLDCAITVDFSFLKILGCHTRDYG